MSKSISNISRRVSLCLLIRHRFPLFLSFSQLECKRTLEGCCYSCRLVKNTAPLFHAIQDLGSCRRWKKTGDVGRVSARVCDVVGAQPERVTTFSSTQLTAGLVQLFGFRSSSSSSCCALFFSFRRVGEILYFVFCIFLRRRRRSLSTRRGHLKQTWCSTNSVVVCMLTHGPHLFLQG